MPSNNYNEPDNELDMFEALAAQFFGGTFNVLQEVLNGGSGHIVINDSQSTAGPPTWDDGSDFRKLAKTKRRDKESVLEEDNGNEKLRGNMSSRSWRSPATEKEQPSQSVISTGHPTSLMDLLFKTHATFQSQGDSSIFDNGGAEGSVSSGRATIVYTAYKLCITHSTLINLLLDLYNRVGIFHLHPQEQLHSQMGLGRRSLRSQSMELQRQSERSNIPTVPL